MAAALDGKVALITGGSAGIGKAAANLFAEAGASVSFAARGAERGERVEQELRQAGLDVRFVQADVSHSEQVQSLIAQTVKQFGRLGPFRGRDGISPNERACQRRVYSFQGS